MSLAVERPSTGGVPRAMALSAGQRTSGSMRPYVSLSFPVRGRSQQQAVHQRRRCVPGTIISGHSGALGGAGQSGAAAARGARTEPGVDEELDDGARRGAVADEHGHGLHVAAEHLDRVRGRRLGRDV